MFLELLAQHQAQTPLDLGAGPDHDRFFFQKRDLQVTCTDLSPAMTALCRAKGLEAHAMNFLILELNRTFDAVFALSRLLHVPKADPQAVLKNVHALLNPESFFYDGVYGGVDCVGAWPNDPHELKLFFASYNDHDLLRRVMPTFEPVYVRRVPTTAKRDSAFHFQSMVWQCPKDQRTGSVSATRSLG